MGVTREQEAVEKWLSAVQGLRCLQIHQAELSSGVSDLARKQVAWTRGDRWRGHQDMGVAEVTR